jgi:hypothetical protein
MGADCVVLLGDVIKIHTKQHSIETFVGRSWISQIGYNVSFRSAETI